MTKGCQAVKVRHGLMMADIIKEILFMVVWMVIMLILYILMVILTKALSRTIISQKGRKLRKRQESSLLEHLIVMGNQRKVLGTIRMETSYRVFEME